MLYQGASISQLARIFAMDNRTVSTKLYGLMPAGQRGGYDYYSIKDAAPYLCDANFDLDDVNKLAEYVRKLNHSNLPKMLTKEFWTAMTAKQKYEENAGELWRTERVLKVFSELVKAVKMPLVLARDTVSRRTELTDRQQKILLEIIDSVLTELHTAVIEAFDEDSQKPAQPQAESIEEDDEL
jgi:hypothetical protein